MDELRLYKKGLSKKKEEIVELRKVVDKLQKEIKDLNSTILYYEIQGNQDYELYGNQHKEIQEAERLLASIRMILCRKNCLKGKGKLILLELIDNFLQRHQREWEKYD